MNSSSDPRQKRSPELQEFIRGISTERDVDFTDMTATCSLGDTALHMAIRGRYFEEAREMVKLGIDVNAQGDFRDTPLHVAARNGLIELTMFLFDHGANPLAINENNRTPAEDAAMFEHAEVLDYLRIQSPKSDKLCNLVDPSANDYKPVDYGKLLVNAIVTEEVELAKELVNLGADQEFKPGTDGRSPIHFVAMVGNVELAKFLTNSSGYVNRADNDGYSPLCLAEIFGHQDIVDYFRETRKGILQRDLDRAKRSAAKD